MEERKTMPVHQDVLSKALHKVGANRWMRRKYYECSMLRCIGNVFLTLNEDGEYQVPETITQRFGSFVEGTTTIGMRSDIDEIHVELNDVIEEGFEGTHAKNVKTIVLVTDMFTPPGFVKMKVDPVGGYKDFILEKEGNGNYLLSNVYTDDYKQYMADLLQMGQNPSDLEKHGPALTKLNEPENQIESIDAIIAFHCKTGLSFNQEFFNRKRYHGWPRQLDLEKMKDQGCLLVPTGHSRCDKKHRILQWRISFSFQERQIMLNLNDAQYKCYILLKLVKKSLISPVAGLTSYHCKTALFYTIENTASVIWSEGNLLTCFILCLKRLKKWSRNRFCPNYFLPELNLFTGKIDNQGMLRLRRIISSIIRSPIEYLQKIPTDNFGKLVHLYTAKATDDRKVEEEVETNVANKLHKLFVDITNSVFHIRSIVLQKISYRCTDLDEIIQRHLKWLHTIKSLHEHNAVGEYQLSRVKWVFPHVSRFLHTSLASHLTIKALETKEMLNRKEKETMETEQKGMEADEIMTIEADKVAMNIEEKCVETEKIVTETEERDVERQKSVKKKTIKINAEPEKAVICWLTLNASYHFLMGLDSDATSSKVKLATVLLYTGHLDIETFKSYYCPTVITQSLCDCMASVRGNLIRENDYAPFINMFKLSPTETLKMSSSEYIEKYVSACTIFLPTESKITFYPLQFEMHRAFGSCITISDDYNQTKFKMSNCEFDNCAALDSKIYGLILTILLSDNKEERERNIWMLRFSSKLDSLAHRETTLNLTGWFVSAEKINENPLYWYKQSWVYNIKQQKFKLPEMAVNDKNAAKWHLALLLFRTWANTATTKTSVD
ncbi:uncharacterized protein LOC128548514 [Mercenaria mercenaria]|uniref:uncharacterized protein LOC128548514 n=1 Tax=Mercenaria mercenaria TaxID=6596 RepID=UPI00234FAFD9|nr:uncharacterized protein LOC128548514 [Mercenaria mercenaria]